ncbi:MAG: GNAT family N-acetyltransferase [Bacteroidota bacterium]
MAEIHIRPANADDLSVIHDLVRELAVYEKEEASFTATLEDYQTDFADGVFQSIVAEMEGEVVGMCLYFLTYSTWKGRMLWLEDFVIRQAYRRHGIGQKLFDALQLRAKEMNCRLMKWQVLDWNEPAIRFYEKNDALIDTDWWSCRLFLNK